MIELIYLVPLLPLIGFFLIGLFGKKLKSEALVGGIASAAVGGAFVVTAMIFMTLVSECRRTLACCAIVLVDAGREFLY